MKTKRVAFIGFTGLENNQERFESGKVFCDNVTVSNLIKRILSERYEQLESEMPEYVIVSETGFFTGMKYDCVRILVTTAPFAPDFNVFDYAIGPDQIICLDDDGKNRYFQLTEPLMKKEISEYQECVLEALKQFLFHIFDQKPEEAKRRLGVYHAGYHEKYLNEYRQLHQSVLYPIVRRIIR